MRGSETMHELLTVSKIVFYSLLMIVILVIMTLALLSILSEDIRFGEGTIELRKGSLISILMKLALCGITMAGYLIMMVLIR